MEIPVRRRVAGRYQLDDVLGRGGMGTVWRAADELLGRPVAIKVIETRDGFSDGVPSQAGARAIREARAAGRLNHPGAVTVYDIVEEDDRFFIVMELIAVPNLAELVQQEGPLPPARAARIGEQVLDVLEYAHAAGIVHRDVKPANVMILPGDRVKLTDFGIASLRGDPQLTSSGVTIGSPRYMSPEQAGGTPAGPEADLWGLGATLYFAVEGRPPFEREGTAEVLAAILTQPPDPMPRAGALAPALTTLLVRNTQQRPHGPTLRRLLSLATEPTDPTDGTDPTVSTSSDGSDGVGGVAEVTAVGARAAATVTGVRPASLTGARPASSTAGQRTTNPPPGQPSEPVASVLDDDPPPAVGGPAAAAWGTPTPVTDRPGPRPARRRTVVLLSALSAVLSVAVIGLGSALQHRSDQTDQTGQQGTSASSGQSGGHPVVPSAVAPTNAGAVQSETLAPLAAHEPATGLGMGSVGRDGLRKLEHTRAAPSGQLLPRFFDSATNSVGGYRVGVPPSYEASAVGPTTFVASNDTMFQVDIEVRSYQPVDAWARLRQDEALFAKEHAADAYRRIRLTQHWTYRGKPATAWEFTWNRNGELAHARQIAFRSGSRTYTVLYSSIDTWWLGGGTNDYPLNFEQSFVPLP